MSGTQVYDSVSFRDTQHLFFDPKITDIDLVGEIIFRVIYYAYFSKKKTKTVLVNRQNDDKKMLSMKINIFVNNGPTSKLAPDSDFPTSI